MVLASPENAQIGDVVVFGAKGIGDPIIHRIVGATDSSVSTKGDHNCASAAFENDIPKENLIGKAVLRIPFLGWIKLGFVMLITLVGGG